MANKTYMFDKRKRKRTFLKYFILFALAFFPVVAFNVVVSKYLDNWLVIFLDCVIMLTIVIIGNVIAEKILARKDSKLNAKIKEREEMQKRKQKIMEDSYKAKRREKQELKKSRINNESKQ